MKELILLTGKDCHLCQEARNVLSEVETREFILEELDIYSKRTYHDKYWDKIPVLIYNNQALLWPFDSQKIQEFLDL